MVGLCMRLDLHPWIFFCFISVFLSPVVAAAEVFRLVVVVEAEAFHLVDVVDSEVGVVLVEEPCLEVEVAEEGEDGVDSRRVTCTTHP